MAVPLYKVSANKIIKADNGNRNNTLYRAALKLSKYIPDVLAEDAVTEMLFDAALIAGLSEREAVATINSGLTAGRTDADA